MIDLFIFLTHFDIIPSLDRSYIINGKLMANDPIEAPIKSLLISKKVQQSYNSILMKIDKETVKVIIISILNKNTL